jgi:hypothetical protein
VAETAKKALPKVLLVLCVDRLKDAMGRPTPGVDS